MTDQPTKPDWPPPDLTITAAEIAKTLVGLAGANEQKVTVSQAIAEFYTYHLLYLLKTVGFRLNVPAGP